MIEKRKVKEYFHSLQRVDIPGITGKLSLGEQNEAGQRLTEFCQEKAVIIANTFLQQNIR